MTMSAFVKPPAWADSIFWPHGHSLWSERKFWSNKSIAIEISKTGEAKGIKFPKLT